MLVQLALIALSLLLPQAYADKSYWHLKDVRKSGALTFVPYTIDQKNHTLQQVKNVLSVWVNRRFKLDYYKNPAMTDPFPRIERIGANLSNMTTEEMHLAFAETFNNLRDRHTSYELPGPYSCFKAYTGIFFTFSESDKDISKHPKVVVKSVGECRGIWNLNKDHLSKVSIGDELISYDGVSFMDYYKINVWTARGANIFGGMRSVLVYLSFISGKITQLPVKDSVEIVLKSHQTGKRYTINIPYVVIRDNSCWNVSSSVYTNVTGMKLPDTYSETIRSASPDQPSSSVCSDDDPSNYVHSQKTSNNSDSKNSSTNQQIDSTYVADSVTMHRTPIKSIFWGIYQSQGKNLGVIRLDNFDAEMTKGGVNITVSVCVMWGLLANQLKDTNAVVFDLRGNPGGKIEFANNIPQLFMRDFHQMGAKYLCNNIKKRFFVDGRKPNDSFRKAYEQSKPGDFYTSLGFYNTYRDVNKYEPAYLKPVGVFTDGNCYSACERLTASFANAGIGLVFGEDGRTGGGGANAIRHPELTKQDPTDFQTLPFYNEMTDQSTNISYANSMNVGIRASVRNDLHNGKIIEDYGVKSDYVFRPQISDLFPDATVNTQLDRIADKLAEFGANKKNRFYFRLEPQTLVVPVGSFELTVEVAGIDVLIVRDINGKQLSKSMFENDGERKNVKLQMSSPITHPGNSKIYIEAYRDDKLVHKTMRLVCVEPQDVDRYTLVKNNRFEWNLESSPFIGVYNNEDAFDNPDFGWRNYGDMWSVDTGLRQSGEIDTDLRFFFVVPVGKNLTVTIDLDYDINPDYDAFYVTYFESKRTIPLLSASQSEPFETTTNQGVIGHTSMILTSKPILTEFNTAELSLRFVSESGMDFRDVTVKGLSVVVDE